MAAHPLIVMREALASHLAALATPAADDTIFAYRHGLGIAFTAEGRAFATGLLRADRIEAGSDQRGLVIRNGNGERAELMTRGAAIALYLPVLHDTVAIFEGEA